MYGELPPIERPNVDAPRRGYRGFLNNMAAARREQFAPLLRSWEAFKDVPPEEVEAEAAKALAEVRAERREALRRSTRAG